LSEVGMMSLRGAIERLERRAREDLESFELLDGSTYYYDRLETYKELFLHAYDVQLGDADKWPEPPEIYRKMREDSLRRARQSEDRTRYVPLPTYGSAGQ
jgi:hypothetical protein